MSIDLFRLSLGVAFEFVPGTLSECRVSLVNATQGDWATLTGLDHLWGDSPSAFFGTDLTNYTYYEERCVEESGKDL